MGQGNIVMDRVVVAAVAAIILAAPLAASAQTPATPETPARNQAFMFERALRGAVELGGQQLAKQAIVVAPELTLSTEEAVVRGVKLTDYGFYFDVQVPSIEGTALLWDMMARARPRQQGPARAVAANGIVSGDPMTNEAPTFDPDREYSTNVRSAVIDAILDSGSLLSLAPDERLTVAVGRFDERRNVNPLYRTNTSKLMLSIKGVDLIELRQGRITREQARERILEDRF